MPRLISRLSLPLALVLPVLLSWTPVSAAPAAKPPGALRCGWIQNPTPGNHWLVDRDGEWVLAMQGGYEAEGMDLIPDLTVRHWARTNGYYGYGCACLRVDVDAKQGRVTRVYSVRQQALRVCRADKALPRP